MKMLPVCSATPSCSSPFLISYHVGVRTASSIRKLIGEDKCFFGSSNGIHSHEVSFRLHVARSLSLPVVDGNNGAGSVDTSIFSPYPDEFDDIVSGFSNKSIENETEKLSCSVSQIDGSCSTRNDLHYFVNSRIPETKEMAVNDLSAGNIDINAQTIMAETEMPDIDFPQPSGNDLLKIQDSLNQTSSASSNYPIASTSGPDSVSNSVESIITENSASVSGSFEAANGGISDLTRSIEKFLSGIEESLDISITKAESAIGNTYNYINSSIKDTIKGITGSLDESVNALLSSVENTKQQAGFSSDFKDNAYKAGVVSVDIIRQTIVSLEDSFAKATTFAIYSYESAKNMLPPEARDVLNISEEKATIILRPVGTALEQVYAFIEGLEGNIGLDPNDPIVTFIVFLGSSATLGVSYWIIKYGGYSGDLSPDLTLELLKKEKSAVLIDVRPEDLREKEGIPDLRRGLRFKYASVTIPEANDSLKKQLKNVKDINDALLAVVIRNLKIVNKASKVILMDARGDRSKGVARSLRRLGVKRPYLVHGGFRTWVKDGLRVKELKPETTLTILNEEAEAILEDIRPTPALAFGYSLGLLAAIYALIEWEKTLQVIGFIGLGQSLYRRFASYEDSEDLREDLRLLLTPVRLGAQVLYQVTGQPEPNKIGLPTSPSSTAVQDRVLQAAAKHESQPSDSDEISSAPLESTSQAGENLDLSEA